MRFSGNVRTGHGRGKKLGFPTANMEPPAELKDGLYLGLANNKPALIFVGAAKTFDDLDRNVEVYILDFKGNLYNHTMEIEILKKIRENIKFASQQKLVEQMKKDEQQAREYFKI